MMTDHKLGRETDAVVHRALWPDAAVEWRWGDEKHEAQTDILLVLAEHGEANQIDIRAARMGYERLPFYTDGQIWRPVPAYSTDLSVWNGVGDDLGWWEASEAALQVQVYWRLAPYDGKYIYAAAQYADHDNNRFKATAYARSLCALQRAERRAEG